MDKLWSTIESSNKSLFRFESLQDYSAEDGRDKVQHYLNTGLLIEYPDTSDWWKEMKKRNDIGIITRRVRLVVEPVTDYTKWELAYLKEAKKYSGDDIKIITDDVFENLGLGQISDFWLIDDSKVFIMKYGEKGKYLGSESVENIQDYLAISEKLLKASLPL